MQTGHRSQEHQEAGQETGVHVKPVYQLREGRLVNCTNRAAKLERDHAPFGFWAGLMLCCFVMGFYIGFGGR
jgi:hypothetical protein